jgi:beta-glucosidase
LVEDLQESLGNGVEVVFAKGSNLVDDPVYEANFTDQNRSTRDDRSDEQLIAEALKVVEGADVIIAALGESIDMSGEGASRAILEMPQTQKKLLDAIQKTGKPIVMVLFTGRPLALQSEEKQVNAILNVWFGGTEAGAAIADVLTGKVSPTGKLTMSFPRVTGQCPIYYNHKMTGRPMSPDAWYTRYVSNYIDVLNEPLYPFGYGLSYTTFSYGDLQLDKTSVQGENGVLTASVQVTNTGKLEGEEVVQLYIGDPAASISRPMKELKNFQKISLKPGESRKVSFTITPEDLKFYNSALEYIWEPGLFNIYVGTNSRDVKSAQVTWNK